MRVLLACVIDSGGETYAEPLAVIGGDAEEAVRLRLGATPAIKALAILLKGGGHRAYRLSEAGKLERGVYA